MRCCKALDLLGHRRPIGRRARRDHFVRGHHVHPSRSLVRVGDGDALAADAVEVDVVFLLNAVAQVLHRHVLLRQLNFEGSALLLLLGQAPALLAQPFVAGRHLGILGLLLRHQLACLGVDLLAVMLQLLDQTARFLDLGLSLLFAADKGGHLAAALLDHLSQLTDPLFEGLPLLLERRAHLLFRRQRHPAVGQIGVRGIALLAQALQQSRQLLDLLLTNPLARFTFPGLSRQSGALLQPFLFLRGQALNLVDDGINLLMEQSLGILQRIELAFVSSNRHLLGTQFDLRLLQTRLQLGLLALKNPFGTADFRYLPFQLGQCPVQVSDLILPAQNGGRCFAITFAIMVTARVNAVPAQQLAAQRHVMERPVSSRATPRSRRPGHAQSASCPASADERADGVSLSTIATAGSGTPFNSTVEAAGAACAAESVIGSWSWPLPPGTALDCPLPRKASGATLARPALLALRSARIWCADSGCSVSTNCRW